MKKCIICNKNFLRRNNRQICCSKICSKKKDLEMGRKRDKKRRKTKKRKNWWVNYSKTNNYKDMKNKIQKKSYLKNKKKILTYQKFYRKRNKNKNRIRSYTWKFLKKLIPMKKCELCGETKRKLCLHHKTYSQKNLKNMRIKDLKNLKVLCYSCHRKIHKGLK